MVFDALPPNCSFEGSMSTPRLARRMEMSSAADGSDAALRPTHWLRDALDLGEGDTPFPWQEELLARFANGTIERSLDIPTGLGKTAVMAIWLVARALGAELPRRLVYVVDRRAVVDQATDEATKLRNFVERNPEIKEKLGLGKRALPISTLRGQFVDNKEWLEDPASPAIIVGTVDMIGSRLLFEGYGTSRKMRPYHAGLLGADTLLVLDEAHLVPPFEKLLEAVTDGDAVFGPREESLRRIIPPFMLLSLSATGRASSRTSFGLQDADLDHPVVKRRLIAPKRLTVLPPVDDPKQLAASLAEQAWKLAGAGSRPVRCIVFCDRRKDAEATREAIERRAEGDKKQGIPKVLVDTQLFVGGRRVFERETAARWLKERGFIASTKVERNRPAFVVATSAGEVGVDLDADHMVSDLVAWERMVQRLGRVNRRGDGDASVIVVVESEPADALGKPPDDRTKKEFEAVLKYEASLKRVRALDCLPRKDGAADASPGALRALKLSARKDMELQAILDAATTPAPLRPALSRALVDAWSMTSLEEHTGRPEIDPWLRGWVDEDLPQTSVVWRTYLPVRTRGTEVVVVSPKEIEAFFDAAPPHASEVLETDTFQVVEWLAARAKTLVATRSDQTSPAPDDADDGEEAAELPPIRRDDVAAFALTRAGDLRDVFRLGDLTFDGDDKAASKKRREHLERTLAGATLVIDARIGGLKAGIGLLDDDGEGLPRTVDDGTRWMEAGSPSTSATPVVRFRVRTAESGQPSELDKQWRERHKFAAKVSEDGEPHQFLIVEKWRHDGATEDDRSEGRLQLLDTHQKWAEERARDLAQRLGLPDAYAQMLANVALVHDEGKRASHWQRAFNAPDDGGYYAKTPGPIKFGLLGGYRHEFGSLLQAEKDNRLRAMSDDLRDLALHLIAAHHGFARPVIRTDNCQDAPPSALEWRAGEVALRFARLQKRWGPWGLAWWESLLRSADQQASRDNDAEESAAVRETSVG
jgi:CRISPR-associated endonuclease/helicase Cas3